jgi:hypothetical protein
MENADFLNALMEMERDHLGDILKYPLSFLGLHLHHYFGFYYHRGIYTYFFPSLSFSLQVFIHCIPRHPIFYPDITAIFLAFRREDHRAYSPVYIGLMFGQADKTDGACHLPWFLIISLKEKNKNNRHPYSFFSFNIFLYDSTAHMTNYG